MRTFAIIRALLPVVQAIVKAGKVDSAGGKRITKEEVESLLLVHLDDVVEAIIKAV